MQCVTDKWGATLKIMHWMYTAIVRTETFYTAIACWEKIKEATVLYKV